MATQTQTRFVKLIMVTSDNNNKFYEMLHEGGTQFSVRYGRVESTVMTGSYDMEEWDKLYKSKIRKGYKDVTEYVTTTVVTSDEPEKLGKIADNKVEEFMSLMKKYTDGLVAKTYSVKATSVTQVQVDAAQKTINTLLALDTKGRNFTARANDLLTELYTIIPRRMSKTQDHLIPAINFDTTMVDEQDKLDSLSSQIQLLQPKKASNAKSKNTQTLLDALGIVMTVAKDTIELEYLLKQVSSTGRSVKEIFEVSKTVHHPKYEAHIKKAKNQSVRLLIHGTRATSVLSILEQGLMIRPCGNYQFSGAVYGNGLYFSETLVKSLGYTGSTTDRVILVYEVHVGNPFIYNGWFKGNSFPLNQKELESRGFDSTFVKAGNGLLNSEIITYTETQNKLKFILWLR